MLQLRNTITCFLLVTCCPLFAQQLPGIRFTHLGVTEGLSSQGVRDFFEDSRGVIWICTTNGLDRYEGNSFRHYRYIPGSNNSLPSDDIWCMREDSQHNFWIGTQNGLCYYEPSINRFSNYRHEKNNSNSLAFERAENIYVDEHDKVWVGSVNGLQQFDPVTKKITSLVLVTKEELLKESNAQSVYQIYNDRENKLWVCAGGALFLIDKQKLSAQKILQNPPNNTGINSIWQDKKGQRWLCFWGKGFARFDGMSMPAEKDLIRNGEIFFRMTEWTSQFNEDYLVISSDHGVSFYNPRTNMLSEFRKDINNATGFAGGFSGALLRSRQNIVWIATDKGVEMVEPSKQYFHYHWLAPEEVRADPVPFGVPLPMFDNGNHYLMGLWHGHGLWKLDSNWIFSQLYSHIPPSSTSPEAKTVGGFCKDEEGAVWISTELSIVKFNESAGIFREFIPSDIKPGAFEFRRLLPMGKDRFLARTRHYGFYIFNKRTSIFEKHIMSGTKDDLPSDDVNAMIYDQKGKLWITTTSGLCCFDTALLQIIKTYHHDDNDSNSLPANSCTAMDMDRQGHLWIATTMGVSEFDPVTGKFRNYTTADGLCNNTIIQVLADKNDNIWINTENGMSVYMRDRKVFRNFFERDGLPKNSIGGQIINGRNKELLISDAGLVMTADPDHIPYNIQEPAVFITEAYINNHFTVINNKDEGQYIEALYDHLSLSIHFSVINYISAGLNKYYYRLEGMETEWHVSDKGEANYINLPVGEYVIHVKGANNDGVMNEKGDTIRIIIHPRWYQSAWFKLLIALLAGIIVYWLFRSRVRQVRKEASFKQRIAETEMQALRAQMNPHFIFNCLNSIENFILQNDKRKASDYLNKFSRLIRSILDSTRDELVPLAKDMESLKLYVELEQLRFNNKFSYHAEVSPELSFGDYKVPPLLIQPYIENAIAHGLAHSGKNDLHLVVKVSLEQDMITYSIADNGVGRERSRQYNQQNKPRHVSVGLQIAAERIVQFNRQAGYTTDDDVIIDDLYNDDHSPAGTYVRVKIKAT